MTVRELVRAFYGGGELASEKWLIYSLSTAYFSRPLSPSISHSLALLVCSLSSILAHLYTLTYMLAYSSCNFHFERKKMMKDAKGEQTAFLASGGQVKANQCAIRYIPSPVDLKSAFELAN